MGTPINYYVDPASGSDMTGDGGELTPWQTTQWALDTISRDSSNGDQINIKTGTDDTLLSALSLSSYGSPGETDPLIFRGYTSAANDGGQGQINGNGSTVFDASSSQRYITFRDLKLYNAGSDYVLRIADDSAVINCEVSTTTDSGIKVYTSDNNTSVLGCYIHNCGNLGLHCEYTAMIAGNYFANGANSFSAAIYVDEQRNLIFRNIISIDGSSNGIQIQDPFNFIVGNAILSSSGTGAGIISTGSGGDDLAIINNSIEGFSGGGGYGIRGRADNHWNVYGHNCFYNNSTDEYNVPDIDNIRAALGNNEALGASPFAKSGSDTFANRVAYFAAADTGDVQSGAYPTSNLDKGAVQSAGGGGGSTTNVFIPAGSGRLGIQES